MHKAGAPASFGFRFHLCTAGRELGRRLVLLRFQLTILRGLSPPAHAADHLAPAPIFNGLARNGLAVFCWEC